MEGKLFGKYRAEVLNVNDPDMRGQVLVKSPRVLNDYELGWAESCFPPGMFFLPRKGDFVWIEFEEGDVQKPVWVGIMPTRDYVKDYLTQGTYTPKKSVISTEGSIDVKSGTVLSVSAPTLTNNKFWSKDDIGSN